MEASGAGASRIPCSRTGRPIRIRAGTLGNGLPEADLIVSPQHRVLVRSGIARTLFGADEVLVAAKQLLALCAEHNLSISQLMLAVPLVILYEISIWCVRLIELRRKKADDLEAEIA